MRQFLLFSAWISRIVLLRSPVDLTNCVQYALVLFLWSSGNFEDEDCFCYSGCYFRLCSIQHRLFHNYGRFCTAALPSDITIIVESINFHLHKVCPQPFPNAPSVALLICHDILSFERKFFHDFDLLQGHFDSVRGYYRKLVVNVQIVASPGVQ